MGEFRMPSLGADMDAGTIVEWRVQPGDVVHRGDIMAVVDTEKSDIEVEVFEDGTVEELLVAPGTQVPVGTPLARLAPLGAPAAPAPAPAPLGAPAAPAPAAPPSPTGSRVDSFRHPRRFDTRTESGGFVRASPRARAEAKARGVDLVLVHGSGPGGVVVARDLDGARPPQAPAEPVIPKAPADKGLAMRHAIATLMARSKREIPHYYLAATVDFGPAADWLEQRNSARPVTDRVLPAALLLKASALAARRHPELNGFWVDDAFQPAPRVHLGVAVSLRGGGLVAPAIHDADTLALDDLMAALKDLVARARSGGLKSSEMADPTITVTNLGDQGVDEVFGVIYPPQVALVGFGRIAHRAVRATLSADHRASDGHLGALFLQEIDRLLQAPEEL